MEMPGVKHGPHRQGRRVREKFNHDFKTLRQCCFIAALLSPDSNTIKNKVT